LKAINLIDDEVRTLIALLNSNPCSLGCPYKDMEEYKENCSTCPITKAKKSIRGKLGLNIN